ncbi:tyrosine kinase [Chloriridovirus anopheles1]|uniref:Tyrosine kinase n=1 Tax=Chloriridovirus anopheles1 TaxID=1465751 RepID=W8QRH8_9VIRU|nr:tyrosine kinase [Anopheles minimus iridovirus]AHL67597.1 tyrosine kinase [Anopheles minimus iridovirus]
MKEEQIIANLSFSYFNHTLKEIAYFIPYFNENIFSSRLHPDAETLEKIFFMGCLYSTDISFPFKFNKNKDDLPFYIKKNQWLTDIKPFGSKSKQGVVSKSIIFDQFYIVVKKAKSSKFDGITIRDFCVGISLNKILNVAPFFVRTLGAFQYKNQFHIALEYIDGINLKDFITNTKNTFEDFVNIFFQILLGLEIAQNKLNFTHYDLHTDNVILVHNQKPIEIALYGCIYTVKYRYKPVMIDFGLSSVNVKNKTIGQDNLENKGIYAHASVGYDMYVFLLFCMDVVQNTNLSILKGINNLLKFFQESTGTSLDILTNNHIKALKKGVDKVLPNQFIQYLVQNYENYLDVHVAPQKTSSQCLLEPTFLKLGDLLKAPINTPTIGKSKKGFIKSTLDHINVYYWYKKKIELNPEEIKILLSEDKVTLNNFIDDLNLRQDVTVEQKDIFFTALEYYYLIIELELNKTKYRFYSDWLKEFRNTRVFKNIFQNLNKILLKERLTRIH